MINKISRQRFCSITLFLFFSLLSAAFATDMTGIEIMQAVEQHHRVNSEVIVETMQMGSGDTIFETRTTRIYRQLDPQGLDQTLIVFNAPPDVRGTALLIKETASAGDDQWLYSPARRRLTRVAQGSKRNYFMGTDFTYEDLELETIDDYLYSRQADVDHAGGPCFVIEAVPAYPERQMNSDYLRRIIYVRKDILYPVEIRFFDRHDQHIKTLVNQDLHQIATGFWRPRTISMDNHQRNHFTTIRINRDEVNIDIPPMVFTERYLISERHLDE